jgi:hypothetical protein
MTRIPSYSELRTVNSKQYRVLGVNICVFASQHIIWVTLSSRVLNFESQAEEYV